MEESFDYFVFGIVITLGLILIYLAFCYGFDKTIDNQNIMLCNSAKKTGNIEYLEKCQEYYQTNNIKYMRSK